jgi:hypothetical protein
LKPIPELPSSTSTAKLQLQQGTFTNKYYTTATATLSTILSNTCVMDHQQRHATNKINTENSDNKNHSNEAALLKQQATTTITFFDATRNQKSLKFDANNSAIAKLVTFDEYNNNNNNNNNANYSNNNDKNNSNERRDNNSSHNHNATPIDFKALYHDIRKMRASSIQIKQILVNDAGIKNINIVSDNIADFKRKKSTLKHLNNLNKVFFNILKE